jgi:mono/diheme cytochrome c family protein
MIALDRAALLLALALCACSRAEQTEGRGVDIFTSEVLPVLEEHCYECHGPDAERVKGGLRITGRDSLIEGGFLGPAVDLSDLDASLMLAAIRYEEPDLEMPPKGPLPEADRAVLEKWVAAGIPWPETERTPQQVEAERFFEQEVRPLLIERCFECHGPDRDEVKGGLRMTGREALIKGGLSGSALTPGDPEASRLIHAVRYTDSLLKMPPRDRLSSGEVGTLEEWILRGAPWPGADPAKDDEEVVDIAAGREWWAFRPVQRPELTEDKGEDAIDALLLTALEGAGITPNPIASDHELIRRAYYDLTGLPPAPEDVAQYIANNSEEKWSALVDELLESKRYGVRYARHWLDVVRYAQTNGYERDREKPYAWRYRDWVIHVLNKDIPYDEFLRQQLAGDESEEVTRGGLAATGFLRLGPWDSEPDDRDQADFDQYDDMVRVISEGFLGVTIGCARCHDHKFDPIRQSDYYGLMAFVRNIRPYRKPIFTEESPSFAVHELKKEQEAELKLGRVARRKELLDEQASFLERERRRQIVELVTEQAENVQDAFFAVREERTPAQIALLRENAHLTPSLEDTLDSLTGDKRLRYFFLKSEADRLKDSFEGELDWILCARESGQEIEPTHLLARGRVHSPKEVIAPGFPPALCADDAASLAPAPTPNTANGSTGLRSVLADWITDPTHPTTARVIANRVWLWHFGVGIVPTPNDLGVAGMPPTNPELLDWLAAELIENDWSLKHLHRVIMRSEAYRRSSRQSVAGSEGDPSNDLLWRQNLQRLSAESVRDAMLATSGSLNMEMGGRGFFPELSKGALGGASKPGEGWETSSLEQRNRRAIYAFSKRNLRIPLLEVLDQANPEQPVGVRTQTTVPTQTLTLTNSAFVNRQAALLSERVIQEVGAERDEQIERLFQLAYQRSPSQEERTYCSDFLREQRAAFTSPLNALTYQSRVPDRLQIDYLDALEPESILYGPDGWHFLKGSWQNEYNDTLEVQPLRGPATLHPSIAFKEAAISFKLTHAAEGDRSALLLRASANAIGSDYRGLSVVFDTGVGTVSIAHHIDPSLPSELLAEIAFQFTPGETYEVRALLCDGEHLSGGIAEELHQLAVTLTAPDGVTAKLKSPIKKTRGERFGLSGWGQLVSFDEISIRDAHHPDQATDSEERHALRSASNDPEADALTSLSLVLLNTNEFLYAE